MPKTEEQIQKNKESCKRYRETHPEQCRARNKRWRDKHPDRARMQDKKWRKNHPEKVKARHKMYDSRERNPLKYVARKLAQKKIDLSGVKCEKYGSPENVEDTGALRYTAFWGGFE